MLLLLHKCLSVWPRSEIRRRESKGNVGEGRGEIPVEERGEDGWLDRTARRGGGNDRGIQNGDEEEFEVYRVTGSGSRQRPLSSIEQLYSSSGPRVVFVCLRLYLR